MSPAEARRRGDVLSVPNPPWPLFIRRGLGRYRYRYRNYSGVRIQNGLRRRKEQALRALPWRIVLPALLWLILLDSEFCLLTTCYSVSTFCFLVLVLELGHWILDIGFGYWIFS